MKNQQGKMALVFALLLALVTAGSFYVGRFSSSNNPIHPSPSSLVVNPVPSSISSPGPEASLIPVASAQPRALPMNTSPVPSVKPDVEIKQEADAKRYIDNKHGFSYKFSNSLTLNNSVSDPSLAQFLEFQKGTGNVARMVSQIFNNPNNSSLDEVIKRENLLNFSELGPKYEHLTIQGHEAVKLTKTMTQTEICNDGDGTTKNRIFNFLVKGDGYVFEIHPNDSCESFKRDWFDITPLTFQFTK